MQRFVDAWKNKVKQPLLDINSNTDPKELIRTVGLGILHDFESAQLLNNYDVYDFLLNYWNEKMQDDAYIIKASGYEAGREIEYVYAQKKSKDENGDEIKVDYTSKMKSFEGALISRNIIEHEYFETELLALNGLIEKSTALDSKLDEIREEESGDEGLLNEVLNTKGDGMPKANLNKRIKELDSKRTSSVTSDINKLIDLFDAGNTPRWRKSSKPMVSSQIMSLETRTVHSEKLR